MSVRNFYYLTVILCLYLLIGCSSNVNSNTLFTGKGEVLLLSETEIPLGWQIYRTAGVPMKAAEDIGVVYTRAIDPLGVQNVINHRVTVFRQEEDAVKFFEENYEDELSRMSQYLEIQETQVETLAPPERYNYKSLVATEFKIIYSPEKGRAPVVGYRYKVHARYGNVISEFLAIVADEPQTDVKAEDSPFLSWVETERLLKLIDDKFQDVGF